VKVQKEDKNSVGCWRVSGGGGIKEKKQIGW
jgi:hypothetical protein